MYIYVYECDGHKACNTISPSFYGFSHYCIILVCVLAPEVASMHPYGHASDWWSLGILMFALLVGQVCKSSLLGGTFL